MPPVIKVQSERELPSLTLAMAMLSAPLPCHLVTRVKTVENARSKCCELLSVWVPFWETTYSDMIVFKEQLFQHRNEFVSMKIKSRHLGVCNVS